MTIVWCSYVHSYKFQLHFFLHFHIKFPKKISTGCAKSTDTILVGYHKIDIINSMSCHYHIKFHFCETNLKCGNQSFKISISLRWNGKLAKVVFFKPKMNKIKLYNIRKSLQISSQTLFYISGTWSL